MNDWVYLHRQLMSWEWYTDSQTVHLFLHLLMKANWKPGRFRGVDVGVGELATGRKVLSAETGISEQSIRTILTRLEKTGEIRTKSTKQFSIITICNYCTYQAKESDTNQQANQQLTNDQPTTNQQLTTSNKGIREEGKKEIKDAAPPAQGTLLEEEYECTGGKKLKGRALRQFNEFWDAFGYKNGKAGAATSWQKMGSIDDDTFQNILDGAVYYREVIIPDRRAKGQHLKMAQGWLTERRWEDERDYVPYQAIADAYNRVFEGVWSPSKGLDGKRRELMGKVWYREGWADVGRFEKYFAWAKKEFDEGRMADLEWQRNLNWLLEKNLEIVEGRYQK